MNDIITVIGVGYVGLVSAVCFADEGRQVICADIDEGKIQMLNRDEMPIYEEGLQPLCAKNRAAGRIEFTSDVPSAIRRGGYLVIAVGTPPLENGDVDMGAMQAVAAMIGENINEYKVVVDKSTVPVGTQAWVESIIREKAPEADFDVVSNPEFLREGTSVYDIQHVDRIIIGAQSERAVQRMRDLYSHVSAPQIVTDAKSAEMIKYASNAFLATKITFINEVANLCDIVGADVKAVAEGMGADKRIAPYFLNAGIGYGGGCFPKDTRALLNLAQNNGYDFAVLDAAIRANDRQADMVVQKAKAALGGALRGKRVAVWGLAFKAGTDDVRGSVALAIAQTLSKEGAVLSAHDPHAMAGAAKTLAPTELAADAMAALVGAQLLLVLTDWPEYAGANFTSVKEKMARPLVLDGRNCLDKQALQGLGFTYIGMGR